jgi:hypothetical protein
MCLKCKQLKLQISNAAARYGLSSKFINETYFPKRIFNQILLTTENCKRAFFNFIGGGMSGKRFFVSLINEKS